MEIKIKVIGSLVKYFSSDVFLTIEEGTTIRDILDQHKLPPEYVMFALINGKRQNFDTKLQENDELVLYPLIAGG